MTYGCSGRGVEKISPHCACRLASRIYWCCARQRNEDNGTAKSSVGTYRLFVADSHVHKDAGEYLVVTPGDYAIDVINWNPLEVGYSGDNPDVEEHQAVLEPSTFTIETREEHQNEEKNIR